MKTYIPLVHTHVCMLHCKLCAYTVAAQSANHSYSGSKLDEISTINHTIEGITCIYTAFNYLSTSVTPGNVCATSSDASMFNVSTDILSTNNNKYVVHYLYYNVICMSTFMLTLTSSNFITNIEKAV